MPDSRKQIAVNQATALCLADLQIKFQAAFLVNGELCRPSRESVIRSVATWFTRQLADGEPDFDLSDGKAVRFVKVDGTGRELLRSIEDYLTRENPIFADNNRVASAGEAAEACLTAFWNYYMALPAQEQNAALVQNCWRDN